MKRKMYSFRLDPYLVLKLDDYKEEKGLENRTQALEKVLRDLKFIHQNHTDEMSETAREQVCEFIIWLDLEAKELKCKKLGKVSMERCVGCVYRAKGDVDS